MPYQDGKHVAPNGNGGGACINVSGTVTSGAGKQCCVWIYW